MCKNEKSNSTWIYCPYCGRKTRSKIRRQSILRYCPVVTHISHIETGRSVPSLEMIISFITAFGCSADELLCVEVGKDVALRSNWLTELVEDCGSHKTKIIADMVVSLKESMRRLRVEKSAEEK